MRSPVGIPDPVISIKRCSFIVVNASIECTVIFTVFRNAYRTFVGTINGSIKNRFVIIAPLNHPFARKTTLDPAELEGQSMVVHEIGSVPHQAVVRLVNEYNISVSTPLELSSNRAIKKAEESGSGIALVSRKVAHEEVQQGTLAAIPLSDTSYTRNFFMVLHKDKYVSKNLQALIDSVNQWARAYHKSQ